MEKYKIEKKNKECKKEWHLIGLISQVKILLVFNPEVSFTTIYWLNVFTRIGSSAIPLVSLTPFFSSRLAFLIQIGSSSSESSDIVATEKIIQKRSKMFCPTHLQVESKVQFYKSPRNCWIFLDLWPSEGAVIL